MGCFNSDACELCDGVLKLLVFSGLPSAAGFVGPLVMGGAFVMGGAGRVCLGGVLSWACLLSAQGCGVVSLFGWWVSCCWYGMLAL